MTDNLESLVLEHLGHIRGRVDQIAEDMNDVKHRISGLEHQMSLVKREVTFGDETDARRQAVLDRLAERIERIERRLDLVP
ncbi:MAG: hypothetical protein HY778_03535 [Betaproteobacteria bacterium]|nr:hypothetical protein [Betaproteobacteria bacterium]